MEHVVIIDAPRIRSLNPNEKRVYQYLKEGRTPAEIAETMHIGYSTSCLSNVHDVANVSVMSIITSIREKGWNIPDNKEEKDMARGQKVPEETVKIIADMAQTGAKVSTIAKETGTAPTTVRNIVERICSAGKPAVKNDIPQQQQQKELPYEVLKALLEKCDTLDTQINVLIDELTAIKRFIADNGHNFTVVMAEYIKGE